MAIGWGFLGWIILGGLAGWIASIIMKRNDKMGLLSNIIAGVLGGLLGGAVLSHFYGGGTAGLFVSFLTAVVGACVIIWLWKLVTEKKKK